MMASSSKQRMSLQPLPADVRTLVRSGMMMTSLAHCVEELVYNSIDAGAKNIHININPQLFNVSVEDDGSGISELDMEAVGNRYSSSRCHTVEDLSNLKYYGCRGEALASIIGVSDSVDISSWAQGIQLNKKFEDGERQGCVEKCNTKKVKSGTIVSVRRLLSKCPVRQKRISKSIQQEEVKNSVEKIALINPNININLSNESNQIFEFKGALSYSEAFDKIFKSKIGFDINFLEESFLQKGFFFQLSVSEKLHKSKHFQFVYVNSRIARRNKLHKYLEEKFLEAVAIDSSSKIEKYPVFMLNITCALDSYDVLFEPQKQKIEFRDQDAVLEGLDGLILKLKLKLNLGKKGEGNQSIPMKGSRSRRISSHDLKGALHAKIIDRSKCESNSGSDRGTLSISPDSSKKRNRTSNTSRVVKSRKRRQESAEPAPQMHYSINNKPRLTIGVFEQFSDWKNQFKTDSANKNAEVVPPKRLKVEQPSDFQRPMTTVAALASPPNSPSAKSIFNWKIERFLDKSCAEEDDESYRGEIAAAKHKKKDKTASLKTLDDESVALSTLGLNSENSLDGLSDTISAFVPKIDPEKELERRRHQRELIKRADMYTDTLVEKWALKSTREVILEDILNSFKRPVKSDKRSKSLNSSLTSLVQNAPVVLFESYKNTDANNSNVEHFKKQASTSNVVDRLASTNRNPDFPSQSKSSTVQDSSDVVFKVPQPRPRRSGASVPPPLNVFPNQKYYSSDWNDNMLLTDYVDSNEDLLFPDNWEVEIVLDERKQEWLQTEDDKGQKVYINLANGESSYDMIHPIQSVKVTSEEMKTFHPMRYKWLRRRFPRGFRTFLNKREREVAKNGDLSKIDSSIIKNSLNRCLNADQSFPGGTANKWKENEYQIASKYFENSDMKTAALTNGKFVNMQCWNSSNGKTSSYRFSREDFRHVNVIGQFDKKFILAGIRKSLLEAQTIVVFDQHAVHERIRLEKLIKESISKVYQGKKYVQFTELTTTRLLTSLESDVRLITSHEDVFNQAGIYFQFEGTTCVRLKGIPTCFLDENYSEISTSSENLWWALTKSLIQEIFEHIIDTEGANLVVLPKTIHDKLCSKACHRAIKFGVELDLETCRQLISELKQCKSLFQCAHGRPSVVPLMGSKDVNKCSESSPGIANRAVEDSECHDLLVCHQDCSAYFCNVSQQETTDMVSSYFKTVSSSNGNNEDSTHRNYSSFFKESVCSAETNNFFNSRLSTNAVEPEPTLLLHNLFTASAT